MMLQISIKVTLRDSRAVSKEKDPTGTFNSVLSRLGLGISFSRMNQKNRNTFVYMKNDFISLTTEWEPKEGRGEAI